MNEGQSPAPEQTLVGADAKLAKAAEIRKNIAERRAAKDKEKAEKAAARQQWWADKRAAVSNMGEAISTGIQNAKDAARNAKDTVVDTGKAAVEGVKTFHDKDVKNKERLQDWIADLPAKAYDTLAAADGWVDNKTDAWAAKLDGTVDSTASRLGTKAEEYSGKVKGALKELQDAKREAKKAIGNIPDADVGSADVLKTGAMLAATERKVAGLQKMQETFASAQSKADSRGRLTRGTANILRKVRGVATFN